VKIAAIIAIMATVFLTLLSCQKLMPWSENKTAAVNGCLKFVSLAFPDLDWEGYSDFLQMGDVDQSEFLEEANGAFIFSYPNIAPKRTEKFAFVCRGNMKTKKVYSIKSEQTLKRPELGRDWSY
jgi:hypothetical protein